MDLNELPKPIEVSESIPSPEKTNDRQKIEKAVDEEPKIEHIFPIVTILHHKYDSKDQKSLEPPETHREVITETTDEKLQTTSEFTMPNTDSCSRSCAWCTNSSHPMSSRRAAMRTDAPISTHTVSSDTVFSRSNMIAWVSTIMVFILFLFFIWNIIRPGHPYRRHNNLH